MAYRPFYYIHLTSSAAQTGVTNGTTITWDGSTGNLELSSNKILLKGGRHYELYASLWEVSHSVVTYTSVIKWYRDDTSAAIGAASARDAVLYPVLRAADIYNCHIASTIWYAPHDVGVYLVETGTGGGATYTMNSNNSFVYARSID